MFIIFETIKLFMENVDKILIIFTFMKIINKINKKKKKKKNK